MADPITALNGISFSDALTTLKEPMYFVAGTILYSIFVFSFYKFLSRKDIFKLNLSQYNNVEHQQLNKTLDVLLYVLEYLLIFPIFVFLWFMVFSIFFIFLAKNQGINEILLISMSLVATIRFTAYYDEALSVDLAKMIPFALLAIFFILIRLE